MSAPAVDPPSGSSMRFPAPTRRRTRWPRALGLAVGATMVAAAVAVAQPAPSWADGPQPRAVIVGDSLTGGNAALIRSTLSAAGLGDVRVEGLSARRIAVSFEFSGPRDSGIARIRRLRAEGVDPQLWVIQLGSNDLASVQDCRCTDRIAAAHALIDQLIAELPTHATIAWVTVDDRARPDVSDDFNTAVYLAALDRPNMTMIRWKALSGSQPTWFADHVHPNSTGLRTFAQLYVDRISAILLRPPATTPEGETQPARRLGPMRR